MRDDTDSADGAFVVEGAEPDAGFGSAVAIGETALWVGAPHGGQGRVYRVEDLAPTMILEGEGKLGSALAATPGGLLAAAPLSGLVLDEDGEPRVEEAGAGISLLGGEDWVIAVAGGWVAEDGQRSSSPGRPASLARLGAAVGLGMPSGETQLLLGSLALPREVLDDEAGFALAAGDVDGDGEPEWVVGAPGDARIDLRSASGIAVEQSLSSSRARFGAALSIADVDGDGIDDLLVGAPQDAGGLGWVGLFLNGDLEAPAYEWAGELPGDQLGFAVAAAPGLVLLGAPGGPGQPGLLRIESL